MSSFPIICVSFFFFSGEYEKSIRLYGYLNAVELFIKISGATLIWALSIYFFDLKYPRTSIIIHWLIVFNFLLFLRFMLRFILTEEVNNFFFSNTSKTTKNAASQRFFYIFGATNLSKKIYSVLKEEKNMIFSGFIDDDKSLIDRNIDKYKIKSLDEFIKFSKKQNNQSIIIAKEFKNEKNNTKLIEFCKKNKINILKSDLFFNTDKNNLNLNTLEKVNIEDYLSRKQIYPKKEQMETSVKNMNVLITGAGGSIGFELAKQIYTFNPKKLILLDLNETSIFNINSYFKNKHGSNKPIILTFLGSACDQKLIEKIFNEQEINTVFHAAAYKHVDIVEKNFFSATKNNILSTYTILEKSKKYKIRKLVLVSTDKAVNPKNFMGASKLICEFILHKFASEINNKKQVFNIVRFGNVLNSSGSVIPIFERQIKNGGPVTVTHKSVKRYFMSIPEAVRLILASNSIVKNSEIAVFDMGKPIKILDLARKMIRYFNLENKQNIKIVFTGLKSGEKLNEKLSKGKLKKTHFEKILISEEKINLKKNNLLLDEFLKSIKNDDDKKAKFILKKLIQT